jgi:CBS domain-containing protein
MMLAKDMSLLQATAMNLYPASAPSTLEANQAASRIAKDRKRWHTTALFGPQMPFDVADGMLGEILGHFCHRQIGSAVHQTSLDPDQSRRREIQHDVKKMKLTWRFAMQAQDVMVSPVVTIGANASVRQAAQILLERRISAVPVVDADNKILGIVTEGDLMHRTEAGTERPYAWWLRLLTGDAQMATDYVKSHARKVEDIMTREVVTAVPDTPLHDVAMLLEKRQIKRVPIVNKQGQLVGT